MNKIDINCIDIAECMRNCTEEYLLLLIRAYFPNKSEEMAKTR